MFTPVLAIIWKALVLRFGIELLSPASNERRHLATWNRLVWLVVGFTVVGTFLSALGFLALPLKMFGWLLWTGSWIGVFGFVFGLGAPRAIGLYAMMAASQIVFRFLISHAPWSNLHHTVEAFDMWRLTFGG